MKLLSIGVILLLIQWISCLDLYFAGSSSAQFSILANWRIGSITGSIATSLPSGGDNLFFVNEASYVVTFSTPNEDSYGKIVIGGSTGTKTLKLETDFKAAEVEIQSNGVLEIAHSGNVTGESEIVSKSDGKVLLVGNLDFEGRILVENDASFTWEAGTISSSVNEFVCNGMILVKGSAQKSLNTALELKQNAKMQVEGSGRFVISSILTVASGAELEYSSSGHMEATSDDGKIKIENEASMEVSSDTTFLCQIENEGRAYFSSTVVYLNKTYAQTSEFASSFVSDAELIVDGASGLVISQGNFSLDGTIRAEGGVIMEAGFFLIGGYYAEQSKRSCSTSTSTVYGSFTVKSNAWLEVTMESSSCYDKFRIFGEFRMESNSGLYLQGRNYYIPPRRTTFDIATHTSRSGNFGRIRGFGIFSTRATYTQTSTRVEITSSLVGSGNRSSLSLGIGVVLVLLHLILC